MQYLVLVHTIYGLEQVFSYEGGGLLCQVLVLRDYVVELAVAAQLKQGVEISFVMEKPVDINNVGVVKKCLYF